VESDEVVDIQPPWLDCGDMGMAEWGSTVGGWEKLNGSLG
jgi:hypothetical protein